jgi:glycosyltransferase involved in cell wall biosynthesis
MTVTAPKITIVTAVFNGAEYIEETINSVLKCASGVKYEYIVVNDGSTDSTLELLEAFGSNISIMNHLNCGESESVTRAFQKARGDYLLVVSADDPLLTSKLFDEVFDWFSTDENLVAVYPDWQMIDPVGNVLQTVLVPDYSDELLIGECRTLPGPGVIFRKDAALKIGGRLSKWVYVGDYDFWLRLSRLGEIRHRSEVLAQWRHHPTSTSVSKRGIDMARERIKVVEDFLSENTVDLHLARKSLGHAYYTAARLTFFSKEVPGKKYLLRAFILRKGWVETAEFRVVAFILLDPISRWLVNPIRSLRVFRIRNL